MKQIFAILSCLLSFQNVLFAQDAPFEIPKQTEISVPASPAFQMLDASSALVTTPGAIRDFKVDWSFKSYRLSPNLSIEAQPIWSFFYNKPYVDKYQKAGKFMQTLTTLSLSAGSLDFNDSIRLFAYAGKITLYRSYDPLTSKDGFQDLMTDFTSQKALLDSDFISLKHQLLVAQTREQKDSLERLVFSKMDQIDQLSASQKQRIQQRQMELKGRYWNATNIDIAFGRSLAFNRFLSERIDSINLEARSMALWINAGFGIGRRWLVTTQLRDENITLTIPDSGKIVVPDTLIDFNGDSTFTSHDSLFVSLNQNIETIVSFGLNIRYGSPRYNFFVEFFYTHDRIPTFNEAKWSDNSAEFGTGGKKKIAYIKEQYLLAFGGEWKISSVVILNYGIRCTVDDNLKLRNVVPLASISCLMR